MTDLTHHTAGSSVAVVHIKCIMPSVIIVVALNPRYKSHAFRNYTKSTSLNDHKSGDYQLKFNCSAAKPI